MFYANKALILHESARIQIICFTKSALDKIWYSQMSLGVTYVRKGA